MARKVLVENRQIFGARSSVTNFDVVGNSNTIECIAICLCAILSELVHRQLDDVLAVSPANKNWCQEFTECYKNLCNSLNLQLAPDCPRFSEEIKLRAIAAICKCLTEEEDLLSMQKLVGRHNDISLMCPFLIGLKRPIIDDFKTTF